MWWWLLLACGSEPVPVPEDPGPTVERIQATVMECARLGELGRTEDARIVWSRAYDTFEAEREAPIRAHLGRETAGRLELEFGLLRHEIDQHGDRITTRAKTVRDDLAESVGALPEPAPPG